MISALVGFWMGLPKWAQDALKWIGVGLLVFFLGKAMAEALKAEGARKANEKNERENFKEHTRTVETVHQIEQETEDAKDRALAAPDAVDDVSSADELRERYPENARVILRPSPSGGRNGPR